MDKPSSAASVRVFYEEDTCTFEILWFYTESHRVVGSMQCINKLSGLLPHTGTSHPIVCIPGQQKAAPLKPDLARHILYAHVHAENATCSQRAILLA